MLPMFESLREAIDHHALEAWPKASCGVIVGEGDALVYGPVTDVADNSRLQFRLEPQSLLRVEAGAGRLAAIVHSHPYVEEGGPDLLQHTPSAAEMREQLRHRVPFGVVVCSSSKRVTDRFWFGDTYPVRGLLSRPFRHGVWDCYSAVRDWYRLDRGLILPEMPRDWNWWLNDLDMYAEGFGKVGFRIIAREDAGPGDAALFRIRAKVSNHAGVLVDSEWMLHHPATFSPFDITRTSHFDRVARWSRFATHWLRPPATRE